MGKVKTATFALIGIVVLAACIGAIGDDGDEDGEIEENGEAEAQAAEEEQEESNEEADESDDVEADEDDSGDEADESDESDDVEAEESEEDESEDEEPDIEPIGIEEDADEDDVDEAEEEVSDEADDEADQETLQAAGPVVFESTLVDHGVMVESVEERGDTLHLEYTTFETTEQGHANEIAAIAGASAGFSGEGYESDRLEATVLGANGDQIGTFHADSDDAQAYYSGEMSDEQYLQNVLETIDV